MLVELPLKDRRTVEAFEAQISQLDEVLECRRMFGIPDYIIRVGVADTDDYERLYMNKLAPSPGRQPRQLAVHDEARQGDDRVHRLSGDSYDGDRAPVR